MSSTIRLLAVFAFAVGGGLAVEAAEPAAARESDAQAVRAASQAYREALTKGNGAALAALWTPDGDIVDDAGRVLRGRETVSLINAPDAETSGKPAIRVAETNLRFVSDDVAIEDGTVEVATPDGRGPLHGNYTATWVRHEGAWKLAALREARIDHEASDVALADLDWMVGDWEIADAPRDHDREEQAHDAARPTMEMRVRWNATRTFLIRDLRITPPKSTGDAAAELHISQRIGWDPLSRSIHSWVFGSDGSHGEADWSRDDGSWVARTTAVHPDGRQSSSINIYTYDGKGRCTWRSLPTHVGGEHEPQVTLTMIRKQVPTRTEEASR